MQARLIAAPQAARVRRQTVEHIFGTLKALDGLDALPDANAAKVRTEMSLHVLAYNLKRVIRYSEPLR